MFKINRVVLAGNLTREIELKYTNGQRAYTKFSVAVDRSVKQADGSFKNVADFVPVAVWGKTAENCQRYLHKGDNVLIEGRISTRSYVVQGEKKFVVEVLADTVQFPPRVTNSEPLRNGYVTEQREGYGTNQKRETKPNDWNPMNVEGFSPTEESSIPF